MVSESKKVREILFRGKREDNGNWIVGSFHKSINDCYIIPLPVVTSKSKVIPETVGQYTGQTDKNGKRIFEGDIIKLSQSGKCYEVKYKSGCFCIGINWAISHEPDCEIIGNIHDNPELLEGYDG